MGKKCIEYIFSHPNHFYDQDAINAILNSDIGIIHFKYNFTVPSLYNENDTFQLHKKWWKSLDEARKHPVIIHYTSTLKPWHKEFKHPSKKYFIDTLRNSLWSDYKINRKYYRIKERIKYAIISNLKNLRDCFGGKLKL